MKLRELRLQYVTLPHPDGRRRIDTPRAAMELCRPLIGTAASEVFMIALLDTKLKLIGVHTVSIGALDQTIVHPREVFKAALLGNAGSIITCHNHPSGDCTPSPDDLQTWKRLDEAGVLLGVEVWDHLIVGPTAHWYTMKEGDRYAP